MKLIALLLCLSITAQAQELCLTPDETIVLGQRFTDLKAQNEQLKKDQGVSVPLVVAFVATAFAVGAATSLAVVHLAPKPNDGKP